MTEAERTECLCSNGCFQCTSANLSLSWMIRTIWSRLNCILSWFALIVSNADGPYPLGTSRLVIVLTTGTHAFHIVLPISTTCRPDPDARHLIHSEWNRPNSRLRSAQADA